MKTLIVYYSRRGQNLVNGKIQTLKIGNTETVAVILQKLTAGDLYRIEPVEDYPEDYYHCIDSARQDALKNARPELRNCPASIGQYDVIYLGYPNYWGTLPMAVFSFLERFDFTGKIIKPFCTYEYDGMGHSEDDIRHACPKAQVKSGMSICGAAIQAEIADITEWASEDSIETGG